MRRLLPLFAAVAVAGCAARPVPLALAPAPAPLPALAFAAPAELSPLNRDLSPAAKVWHVRAALNVAALACRGPQGDAIVARYNAMLATQKDALARAQAALSDEFQRGGGDWQGRYDGAMTRLYNFFSRSPARDRFCIAAAGVLDAAAALPPAAFADFAAQRLPELDAPFAAPAVPRPVIALAAPVPQAPAEPRIALDLAALD